MKIIGCGYLSFSMIILILLPFVTFINNYVLLLLTEENNGKTIIDLNEHPFILDLFLFFMTIITGGIFFVIFRIRSRSTRVYSINQKQKTINLFQMVKIKEVFESSRSNWFLLGLIYVQMILRSGSSLFSLLSLLEAKISDENETSSLMMNTIILQIIFNGLISLPILKYHLYNHHYFAIFLLIISFVLVSLKDFITNPVNWLQLLYTFSSYLCWAIQETNAKWIMKEFHITPFFLLFLYGINGLIYQLLISVPFSLIPCTLIFCNEPVIENYWLTIKTIFSYWRLGILIWVSSILATTYELCLLLVNNAFNPTHSCSAESLENVIWWIKDIIEDKGINILYFSLSLIGYCILIIGGMIYNEIIICYQCNLHIGTKNEICERATRDSNVSSELEAINVGELVDNDDYTI